MKWIKLRDKLPPPNTYVLIWWTHGSLDENGKYKPGVYIGSYRSKVDEVRALGGNYDARNEISHWMHMPKEPENK